MLAGDRLYPNDFLISQDGRWKLKYQTDGNLVLYNADESESYWDSGTVNTDPEASNYGQAAGYLVMQPDGNLVIYSSTGGPYWAKDTDGNPGAFFFIQDDRNLILARANGSLLWSPSTCDCSGPGTYRMLGGDRLYPNDFLISQDGRWKLKYRTDGNLVLYNADESESYWNSGTVNTDPEASNFGQAAGYLLMQYNGNLVMFSNTDNSYWFTSTAGNPGATFRIQDDRNLILTAADGGIKWTSNSCEIGCSS